MLVSRTISVLASTAIIAGFLGCGGEGGGTAAPKGGSPEWHWENASFYAEKSEFSKMAEELEAITHRETPLKERARVWRMIVMMGVARGHLEVADAYRAAIKESPGQADKFEKLLPQVNREVRQFAIELTESLGDIESAWGDGEVVCEFPFPEETANLSPVIQGIQDGQDVGVELITTAAQQTVFRGIALAATEFCGFGEGAEFAPKAKTAINAGPVTVSNVDAHFRVAKILLDISLTFSQTRTDEPKIREAIIGRAEQWITPYLESEDDDLKKRAQEFAEEIEDEKRDMDRKARRVKKRE